MDPVWAHIFPSILNSVLASLRSSVPWNGLDLGNGIRGPVLPSMWP